MSRKILIIDDKPFMVRLIQHHLERAGYELIKARNPQEAADAIALQSPELVLLDESGANQITLGDFKAKEPAHRLPVIRMTDMPQTLDENHPGNEVVLTRPFSPTHLVAEVKRLVRETK